MALQRKGGEKTPEKTAGAEVQEKVGAQVTAEQSVQEAGAANIIGSMSDKLHLVAPLGDPSNPDTTNENGVKKVTSTIVGYRFKADVDLEVPDVEVGDDFKKNLMSFKGDPNRTRHVPAGTEFDLTRFETGMLISRDEFNGKALGGDKPVVCSYNASQKKGSTGTVMTTSGATSIPSISLRAAAQGASIKDFPIIDVLDYTTTKGENNTIRKVRTIKPGFEKFAALCITNVRTPGQGRSTAGAANVRNKGAETFLKIAAMHGGANA